MYTKGCKSERVRKKPYQTIVPIINLLTGAEVAATIGISYPVFRRLLDNGDFPPPTKVGRYGLWRKETVEAYILKMGLE